MEIALRNCIQEAREAYNIPRRVAEVVLSCGNRVLENYEQHKSRTPLEITRKAAEEFKAPELMDQAYAVYPQEWPHIPLPERIEDSLLANAAKQIKESSENVQAVQGLMVTAYGKESRDDLTQKDHEIIEIIVCEGAEAVRAYKKFCVVLVKKFGYAMNEIDSIIAQRLGTVGQKEKTAKKAVR